MADFKLNYTGAQINSLLEKVNSISYTSTQINNILGSAVANTATIAVAHGGTGGTTVEAARKNLMVPAIDLSGSYPKIVPIDSNGNVYDTWIRLGSDTTGIIPNSSGTGHGYIGTSSWHWGNAYIDHIYGTLHGNLDGYINSLRTIGGSNHAAALQTEFTNNKASIPRNSLLTYYSSAYGTGSQCMGYFLAGYDSGPYGGFFVCQYYNARYVGITGGTFSEYDLTKTVSSSKRIKENILPIKDEDAKKLLNITPVSFDYKKNYGEKNQYGFVAEELQEKFSYPVVLQVKDLKELEENPTSIQIDYIKFIPHIVKLCQIQQKEIDELKAHIISLQKKVGDMNG